jgi:hypothetical protein
MHLRQAFECGRFVGWVERSDVNQLLPGTVMGFATLTPSYDVCNFCCCERHREPWRRNPALLQR